MNSTTRATNTAMATKTLTRRVIANPAPQNESALLLLPNELLLEIIFTCGLNEMRRFKALCKSTDLLVDPALMKVLFLRELRASSGSSDTAAVSSSSSHSTDRAQLALRYNAPEYLAQGSALTATGVQQLLAPAVAYLDKSPPSLLHQILEYDADHVLLALVEVAEPRDMVPALLREYGEGLTRVKSRLLTSRVGHVVLTVLAKHSALIGQLVIGADTSSLRGQPATLLAALLKERKYTFHARQWLEQCCQVGQQALFDTLLSHVTDTDTAPFIAIILNRDCGARPSGTSAALLDSAVKHGAGVNVPLPSHILCNARSGVKSLKIASPLAIAYFGYSGATKQALIEWLLLHGAQFSAEEVQSIQQAEPLRAARGLLTVRMPYSPFTKKGIVQGKSATFTSSACSLVLAAKDFSYYTAAPHGARNCYTGTWQYSKATARLVCAATALHATRPRTSYNDSEGKHVKSTQLSFVFTAYVAYDGGVFLVHSGVNVAQLKVDHVLEFLMSAPK